MPAVRLSGVSKHFGEAVAVDRLDLSLNAGSLSTFLGPSGCGKTTTLRLVAGLEHPTSGRIEIDGDCVFGPDGAVVPAERRGIGMVFQSYAVWPHLTVFENVAYPLRVKRLPREDIRRRVELALTTVRLLHLRERYPGQLSGGQQQRVALARALVVEPKLLLLDEPLSNLDAQLRDEMRAEIRNLQVQLGLTAIYVTHDQQEALAISDAVIVMERGRIVQQGTPREIYEHPNCRFVAEFLGWTNFLPVEVLDRDHARILGMTLQCRSEGQTSKSEPLCAAVRPDHISLATHSDGPAPTVQARVRSVTYLGTHCACVFEVGGVALQASLVSQAAPAPRSIVALSLDPAGIRIIPGTPTSERPG